MSGLALKLAAETNLFTDVWHKGDLPMMWQKPCYSAVPDNDQVNTKQRLQDVTPFIQKFSRSTNLVSLFEQNNAAFARIGAARNECGRAESLIQSLPALTRIVSQADASLNGPGTPPSPGAMALLNAGDAAVRQTYQSRLPTGKFSRDGARAGS